jgi:hypothetical protein
MTARKSKSAIVSRSAKTGQFVVRKDGGTAGSIVTTYTVKPVSSETISKSLARNRDALQRLANR